ncbi:hypothetical protein ABZW02_20130 [Streptomyces sp. NPDC005180]|uniref:hypothetical protein n=1 Tax=Streptomyces sp. NPDC005180 TaxID=3156868 RepID=UPI0033A1BBA5
MRYGDQYNEFAPDGVPGSVETARVLVVDPSGECDEHGNPRLVWKSVNGFAKNKAAKRGLRSDQGHAMTTFTACVAIQAGWTFQQWANVMQHTGSDTAGAQHVRDLMAVKTPEWVLLKLRKIWDQATAYTARRVELRDRSEAITEIIRRRDNLVARQWRGMGEWFVLRAVLAHLDAAVAAGSLAHGLSEREAAERSGMTHATLHKVRQQPLFRRLIKQLSYGSPTDASRWLIRGGESEGHEQTTPQGCPSGGASSGQSVTLTPDEPVLDGRVIASLMHLDAFTFRGLNINGLVLLSALESLGWASPKELVGVVGSSKKTVDRKLRTLREMGLVVRTGGTYRAAKEWRDGIGEVSDDCEFPAAGWVDVARQLHVEGVTEKRRELHRRQREYWLNERLPELMAKLRAAHAARETSAAATPTHTVPAPRRTELHTLAADRARAHTCAR